MIKRNGLNIIFFIIAGYAVYLHMPSILNNFKFQDQKAKNFTVKTINGEDFNLYLHSKNIVVVFWATWCGPCEAELDKINKMIMQRKILPSDVLAISINEPEAIVKKMVKSKNYLFNVGVDSSGKIASLYNVTSTPTVVFIDQDQIINWMTAGLSPTLEFRMSSFLK